MQGLQALCRCHKRGCGATTDLDSGEHQHSGEDFFSDGIEEVDTSWQKGVGEGARVAPEEAQEHCPTDIGETKLDQQRDNKSSQVGCAVESQWKSA